MLVSVKGNESEALVSQFNWEFMENCLKESSQQTNSQCKLLAVETIKARSSIKNDIIIKSWLNWSSKEPMHY